MSITIETIQQSAVRILQTHKRNGPEGCRGSMLFQSLVFKIRMSNDAWHIENETIVWAVRQLILQNVIRITTSDRSSHRRFSSIRRYRDRHSGHFTNQRVELV